MIAAIDASTWLAVTALASLSILSTALGVGLAYWVGPRSGVRAAGVGFSVGVMVAISLLELLPEASREAGVVVAAIAALTGAGLLAVLHAVIPHVHLVAEDSGLRAREVRRVYLIAFGLILHDFPEGFAMANAYLSAPRLGVVVAIRDRSAQHPRGVRHGTPGGDGPPPPLPDRRGSSVRRRGTGRRAHRARRRQHLTWPERRVPRVRGRAMVFVAVHELVPLSRELGRRRDTTVGIAVGAGIVVLLGLLASA